MIKIGSVHFPQELSDQVAECFTSLPLLPKEVRLKETYVYNEDDKEVRAFSIFEYEEAHEKIAVDFLEARYRSFSKIPGLTYSIENWLRVADALEIIETGDFNPEFSLNA